MKLWFDMIKKYCGQDNNIRLVDKIEKVEDIDKAVKNLTKENTQKWDGYIKRLLRL